MCNLTGYSGKVPANVDKMKLLFIYGNRRGKDGFGVVMGKQLYRYCGYEKGTDFSNSENAVYGTIFHPTKNRHTIIAHNRAKSVGTININNTHPFKYHDESKNVTLFFAHNGTISNIEELAKKYNVTMNTGDVDSKILGEIIYKNGFDVLKEYTGYAAFSLLDYEEDALYLWKGLSQCDSVTPSEERPLAYWQNKTKTQFYYASEKVTLSTALNIPLEDILDIEPNYLYKIKDGKILSKTYYDRSHIEYKPKKTHFGHGGWNDDWAYDRKHTKDTVGKKSVGVESEIKGNISTDLLYDKEPSPQQHKGAMMYFWKGRYYSNGHLLNGIYYYDRIMQKITLLNRKEDIDKYKDNVYTTSDIYYFKEGYMIKNHEMYEKLIPTQQFHAWSVQGKQNYIHPETIVIGPASYTTHEKVIVTAKGVVMENSYIRPLFSEMYYYAKSGEVFVSKFKTVSVYG